MKNKNVYSGVSYASLAISIFFCLKQQKSGTNSILLRRMIIKYSLNLADLTHII